MTLVEVCQLSNEMQTFAVNAARVCTLLRKTLDESFSDRPQKDIPAYDAGAIEAILSFSVDILEREITHFCYKTGDADPEYYPVAVKMNDDSNLRQMCDLTVAADTLRDIIWKQRNPHKEEALKELINSPIDEATVCKLRELANS